MRIFFLLFFLLNQCAKVQVSNLGVETWKLRDDDGKTLSIQDLPGERIAINVYSPTCVPCVEEIPALNAIRDEIATNRNFHIVMAVDTSQWITTGIKESDDDIFQKARTEMKTEIAKRGIRLPVYYFLPPLRVGPQEIITGTPETLLFQKNPTRLFYNFLGPISTVSDPKEVTKDLKYKFFKRVFGLAQ